jgi:Family of unknown function (DUF5320)
MDKTGPFGTGPAGRGQGRCRQAGGSSAGGRGQGRGWGGGGRGNGRGGFCGNWSGQAPLSQQEEAEMLEEQIAAMQARLNALQGKSGK